MNPEAQLCPQCGAEGKDGKIGIHSQKEQRYRCKACQRTFSATHGSAYYGLKKADVFTIVITLLSHGCPPQAVVAAYGLSDNTVRDWLRRSGMHCQQVHEQTIGQQQWDLQHIQADEMKVRTQFGDVWIAMVMMVSTRLWLGASVSTRRSKKLIVDCLRQAARCALCRPLLLAVDGFNMYVNAAKQCFGARHPVGKKGYPKWVAWKTIIITQVIKQRRGKQRQVEQVVVQGDAQTAHHLRQASGGGTQINTAFIERLNATFRQCLSYLTRRGRAQARQPETLQPAIFLIGCVYNFCSDHASLAQALYLPHKRRHWVRRTPAMAAGLTDHRWTVQELLAYKIRDTAA